MWHGFEGPSFAFVPEAIPHKLCGPMGRDPSLWDSAGLGLTQEGIEGF